MKLHRNTIWVIPLFLCLTFPFWSIPVGKFLTPRGGFDPEIKKAPSSSHDFKMDRVKITQNQGGKTTAFIIADHARTSDNPDILLMDNVDADLFDDNNAVTNVTSIKGKYNSKTELLTLTEDVVVHKTADNQYLYTELLHYDNQLRTVHCPGPTTLVGDGVSVDGGRLHYDILSQTYIIDKRVYVILQDFKNP
jgi:LPS export ABC transporter protein LptC